MSTAHSDLILCLSFPTECLPLQTLNVLCSSPPWLRGVLVSALNKCVPTECCTRCAVLDREPLLWAKALLIWSSAGS